MLTIQVQERSTMRGLPNVWSLYRPQCLPNCSKGPSRQRIQGIDTCQCEKGRVSICRTANNKAKINLVKTNFPDTFHEGLTKEEEYTIGQMARMVQPGSDTE
jgi:hypothetical protein